jgi:hypothetical protein
MVTRVGVAGNEHVAALVFVSVAKPAIVPVAPLRAAVAESCDARQAGGPTGAEPPERTGRTAPPIVSA